MYVTVWFECIRAYVWEIVLLGISIQVVVRLQVNVRVDVNLVHTEFRHPCCSNVAVDSNVSDVWVL
jgi:hypothetical protein